MLDVGMGTAGHVRSVPFMIVITAAGGSLADCAVYRSIIEAQARKCKEFGYRHRIYNLGNLGIGEFRAVPDSDFKLQVNGDSLPAATFKAALVAENLAEAKLGDLVMWMDADCLPLRDLAIPRSYGEFDAAVTLRPAAEIGLSNNSALDYLNSGVVGIRNTQAGSYLCDLWSVMSRDMNTDQGALNEAVTGLHGLPIWLDKSTWEKSRGNVIVAPIGARVLMLDCTEWNSWAFPPSPQARILHFKRGLRYLAKDYLNR